MQPVIRTHQSTVAALLCLSIPAFLCANSSVTSQCSPSPVAATIRDTFKWLVVSGLKKVNLGSYAGYRLNNAQCQVYSRFGRVALFDGESR